MKTSVCRTGKSIRWVTAVSVVLLVVAVLPAWSVTYLSGPATLSRSGETYVVNQDFSCSGTAFAISASNVVLDLGGHTVVYGSGGSQAYGVYITGGGAEVKNGTLVQHADGAGYGHAVYLQYEPSGYSGTGPRVHDVTIRTVAPDSHGVYLKSAGEAGGTQVYNCQFNCAVLTTVLNDGNPAIRLIGGGSKSHGTATNHALVHHNTVNAATRGIRLEDAKYVDVYENRISPASPPSNAKHSKGICLWNSDYCRAWNNTITGTSFGGGLLIEGGASDNEFWNCTVTVNDSLARENIDGLYVRFGAARNKIHDCTFTINSSAADGTDRRIDCVYLAGAEAESGIGQTTGNQIYSCTFDMQFSGNAGWQACIILNNVDGPTGGEGCFGNVIRNCRLKSNIALFDMTEPTAAGQAPNVFQSCELLKGGNPHASFALAHTYNGGEARFLDNTLGSGVEYNDVSWGSGGGALYVEWYLQVAVRDQNGQPASGATVEIRDANDSMVFSGTTAADGTVRAAVRQRTERSSGDVVYTPHTVTASKSGYSTATMNVTADASKQVTMSIGGSGGVSFTQQADKSVVVPGGTITYTLSYANTLAETMHDARLTYVIPAATTFVEGSATHNGDLISPDPVQDGTLVMSLGDLAPGATGTVTFQLKVK